MLLPMVKKNTSKRGVGAATTMANQDAFLLAFGSVGSIKASCEAVNVGRSTVTGWQKADMYGFRTRFLTAQEIFRENLQDMAVNRILQQKPNDNPLLLVTLLNAHWPEKYRRDGQVATNEVKEMMVEWKKWVSENKKKGKPKEDSKVVDEAEQARINAIDEVEKILSRRGRVNDNSSEN